MSDLPEPPVDDAVELASRYVDGDVSADERATAEADPEVMAWVERFGGIRAALQQPITVDATARDAALAAALTAFDEGDGAAAPPAPPVVSDLAAARARRAGRLGRWLGAAAAVAVLAVGGVVLVNNSDSGGDDSADVAPESAKASDEVSAGDDSIQADRDASTMVAADTTAAAGAADAVEAPAAAPATTTGGAGSSGGGAPEGASPTTAASTDATALERSFDLTTASDLAMYADATPVAAEDGPAPCVSVAAGEPVARDVTYDGVPAVVYRDAATRSVIAWSVADCTVLDTYTYG